MDNYLRTLMKKSAALQAPPLDGKMRLLKAASAPDSQGFITRMIRRLFSGTHPLERVTASQAASEFYFDSEMVWAFRSGLINLRFIY